MGTRFAFYVGGLVILTLGITLLIRANLGAGPWDTVFVGAYERIGLTVGTWFVLFQVLCIAMNAVWLRVKPELASVITIVTRGLLLDGWLEALADLRIHHVATQWLAFLLGTIFIALGTGMYMAAQFPLAPLDRLRQTVAIKLGISLKMSVLSIEALAMIIGFVLGGPVGLGTVLFVFVFGYLVQGAYRMALLLYNWRGKIGS